MTFTLTFSSMLWIMGIFAALITVTIVGLAILTFNNRKTIRALHGTIDETLPDTVNHLQKELERSRIKLGEVVSEVKRMNLDIPQGWKQIIDDAFLARSPWDNIINMYIKYAAGMKATSSPPKLTFKQAGAVANQFYNAMVTKGMKSPMHWYDIKKKLYENFGADATNEMDEANDWLSPEVAAMPRFWFDFLKAAKKEISKGSWLSLNLVVYYWDGEGEGQSNSQLWDRPAWMKCSPPKLNAKQIQYVAEKLNELNTDQHSEPVEKYVKMLSASHKLA